MALTMRPTGLSSPAYKDEIDVSIYEDGEAVGRVQPIELSQRINAGRHLGQPRCHCFAR